MDSLSSNSPKPKRGRPPIYTPEQKIQAYKEKHKLAQHKHYQTHKQDTLDKAKYQGHIYRFAYKLLLDIWNDQQLSSEKYNSIVKALIEDKQITNY
jgi:hypothetical protein